MTKKEIKNLISEGELDRATEALLHYTKTTPFGHNKALEISYHFEKFRKKRQSGSLDFIDEMDQNTFLIDEMMNLLHQLD